MLPSAQHVHGVLLFLLLTHCVGPDQGQAPPTPSLDEPSTSDPTPTSPDEPEEQMITVAGMRVTLDEAGGLTLDGGPEANELSIATEGGDIVLSDVEGLDEHRIPSDHVLQVAVHMGAGPNVLRVTGLQLAGSLLVESLGGPDQVSITDTTLGERLTIDLGDGSDTVILEATSADQLDAMLGGGDDLFRWEATRHSSRAHIDGGQGEGDRIRTGRDCSDMSATFEATGFEIGVASAGYVEQIDLYAEVVTISSATPLGIDDVFGVDGALIPGSLAAIPNTTAALQLEIDRLAGIGGGIIDLDEGLYKLASVQMGSQVHLRVHERAHLLLDPEGRPAGQRQSMFIFSNDIYDTSLRSKGDNYSVYLDTGRGAASFAETGYVTNFLIQGADIFDNYTKFSAIGAAPVFDFANDAFLQDDSDRDAMPTGGTFRDLRHFDAHTGYGLVQTSAGRNLHFENIYSRGGITLRLETHWLKMNGYGAGGVFDIRADGVTCEDGFRALVFTPHTAKNGRVEVRNVTSDGTFSAVGVQRGWISPQHYNTPGDESSGRRWGDHPLTVGWFDSGSSVDGVVSSFGTKAQCQPYRDLRYYPESMQSDVVSFPHPHPESLQLEPLTEAPSLFNVVTHENANFSVRFSGLMTVDELRAAGFAHLDDAISYID